jgi:DNA-directed RNA polymerase specialized sigma24 family protein
MAAQSAGEAMRRENVSLDDVSADEIQRLVALGTVLSGNGAAGEDLAHAAFLQLVECVSRELGYLHGPAWPLLRTMVVRLALQRRRAWARELRRLARAWQPAPSEG